MLKHALMTRGRSHFMIFLFVHFTLSLPENLYHFLNLCDDFQFNTFWHRRYAIIFGLTWCCITVCGRTSLILEASRKWLQRHIISHMYGYITLVIQSHGWCSSPLHSIGFCYQNEWETLQKLQCALHSKSLIKTNYPSTWQCMTSYYTSYVRYSWKI